MKKILAYMLSLLIICSLLISCGKNEEQVQTLENPGNYSTVAEWIEKESENIKGLKDSMDGTDLELNVIDRGKSLVYQYRFTKISGKDVTFLMKEQLNKDIEEQKEAMGAVLEMLKKEVPDAESVIYEYYTDMDSHRP